MSDDPSVDDVDVEGEYHRWYCEDCGFSRIRPPTGGVAPHGVRHRRKSGHDVEYQGPGEPTEEQETTFAEGYDD